MDINYENPNYKEHHTSYGVVKKSYDKDSDVISLMTLFRPKKQTEPLTMAQIGEIIETIYDDYYYNMWSRDFWGYELPSNFHEELVYFQAQLMQQKYETVEVFTDNQH